MIRIPAHAEQTRAHAGKQLGTLDQREPRLEQRPPGQERRDGEEELVDDAGLEERADYVRAAFVKEQPVAARAQRITISGSAARPSVLRSAA